MVGSRGRGIRYLPGTCFITLRVGIGLEIHMVFVYDCQNLMEDPICLLQTAESEKEDNFRTSCF